LKYPGATFSMSPSFGFRRLKHHLFHHPSHLNETIAITYLEGSESLVFFHIKPESRLDFEEIYEGI